MVKPITILTMAAVSGATFLVTTSFSNVVQSQGEYVHHPMTEHDGKRISPNLARIGTGTIYVTSISMHSTLSLLHGQENYAVAFCDATIDERNKTISLTSAPQAIQLYNCQSFRYVQLGQCYTGDFAYNAMMGDFFVNPRRVETRPDWKIIEAYEKMDRPR